MAEEAEARLALEILTQRHPKGFTPLQLAMELKCKVVEARHWWRWLLQKPIIDDEKENKNADFMGSTA